MKKSTGNYIKTLLILFVASFILLVLMNACSNDCSGKIAEIKLSSPNKNILKVMVEVKTTETLDMFIEYWRKDDSTKIFATAISKQNQLHRIMLTNLNPKKEYGYRVVTKEPTCESRSNPYSFSTPDFPMWIPDFFKVVCPDSSVVPAAFRKGYMMIYRRETPGIIFLINDKSEIAWYHQVDGTGFKTAHFTNKNTILSILGTEAYPTSYGNEILEVSLTGDTLFHLKKGEKDFTQTIHHEILSNKQDQVATLCVEEKIMDLRSVGGKQNDTLKTDGIIVFDRKGKAVWRWSVLNELDPLKDKNILKEHRDWMHANSLNYDADGNFLISFYNNGQVWKIDAKTGKLIWKFGKEGDFTMPPEAIFDQGHAVHMDKNNNLVLFDNGTSKKLSRTLIFKLNEKDKTASLLNEIKLPPDLYNERMGSSYLVNDTSVLQCVSKRNTVVLTNLRGTFLWALRSSIMPYRVEFIPGERLRPYIFN